jgi:hypothetical protein
MDIIDSDDHRGACGAAVSASMTLRTSWSVSAEPEDANAANAASGSVRADVVATAQRISAPLEAAAASASQAIRLFPTPAAPHKTTPAASSFDIAAEISRISSARPVNGHVKRIETAYERSRRKD